MSAGKPVGSIITPPRPPDSMLDRPAAAEEFGLPLWRQGLRIWQWSLPGYVAISLILGGVWIGVALGGPTEPLSISSGEFYLIVVSLLWIGICAARLTHSGRKRA